MSNLWDLNHIQPAGTDVLAGDTIAAMFWNAVAERGLERNGHVAIAVGSGENDDGG